MKTPTFKSFTDYALWSVQFNARAFARQRKEQAMMDPEMIPMGMKPPKKFCADCKWAEGDKNTPSLWECKSPKLAVRMDLVSGNPLPNFCSNIRLGDQCGPAGNLWEPQD